MASHARLCAWLPPPPAVTPKPHTAAHAMIPIPAGMDLNRVAAQAKREEEQPKAATKAMEVKQETATENISRWPVSPGDHAGDAAAGPARADLAQEFASSALFREFTRRSIRRGLRKPSAFVSIQRRWFLGRSTHGGAFAVHQAEYKAGNLASDEALGQSGLLVGTAVLLDMARRGSRYVSTTKPGPDSPAGYTIMRLRMPLKKCSASKNLPDGGKKSYYVHDEIVVACLGFADRLGERKII